MKYIVTSVDYFTKFVEAKPIPNKSAFKVVNLSITIFFVIMGASIFVFLIKVHTVNFA